MRPPKRRRLVAQSALRGFYIYVEHQLKAQSGGRCRQEGDNALGSDDGEKDDVNGDCANQDALHARVIGHDRALSVHDDRSLQVVTTRRFDLRRRGRNHLCVSRLANETKR